jgi:hypothetical protein
MSQADRVVNGHAIRTIALGQAACERLIIGHDDIPLSVRKPMKSGGG